MPRTSRDRVFKIVFVIILAAFCIGVVQLMTLRFKIGDVYPAYSSLRSDPLGTKAYMESLDRLAGVRARRNLKDLAELGGAENSTIFLLGIKDTMLFYMSADKVETIESLAASGNRVVFTLYPKMILSRPALGEKNDGEDEGHPEGKDEQKESEDATPAGEGDNQCDIGDEDYFPESAVSRDLRFSLGVRDVDEDSEVVPHMSGILARSGAGLPLMVSWHSDMYFKDMADNWDVVYELDGRPVMIERQFGDGSIVLATDSFFVSNEALLSDRHPALLAWLVGDNPLVVFDETHLGIGENPGIVSLMRKYNLHGLLAGILVLAVLFVWKNSTSLVPPTEEAAHPGEGSSQGKDYGSGVVSLLRRNVPSGNVLFKCFEEWKHSFPKKYARMPQKIKLVRKILESEKKLPARQRNPVKAYRKITEILSERKSI